MLVIQFNDTDRVKAVQRWHGRTLWIWQKLDKIEDINGREVPAWVNSTTFTTRSLHAFLKQSGITRQDCGLIVL